MADSTCLGAIAISEIPNEGAPTLWPTPTTYRFATHTITTASDDTPANTVISGRILTAFSLNRQISDGPEGRFGGLLQTGVSSELSLANPDRELDYLFTGYPDGRPVRLLVGSISAGVPPRYDALMSVLTATAGAFVAELDTATLRLRDQGIALQNDVQNQSYSGTGRQNGSAELAGRSRPFAIGTCLNVSAQIINPEILTYQVATRALTSLTIYDAGIAIPVASDQASYSKMIAANCPPGQAVTCLSDGLFKLGTYATGRVTADLATGHNTTAAIIDQLLAENGIAASSRAIAMFTGAVNDVPGYFQAAGDNTTVEDVIVQLAESAGAVFGSDRSGVYRLFWLDASAFDIVPDFSFEERAIIEIERLPLPYGVPWLRFVMGGQKNWTVQPASELALGLAQDRIQFLEKEFREIRTGDPTIAAYHLTSRETGLIPTLFSTRQAAINAANRLASWYSIDRAMYRIVVKTALCAVEIGDIVEVTVNRWNLDTSKSFVVVGISDDLDAVATELTLFG